MMLLDIVKKLEEKYPKNLACEWDNVGLLIGSLNNNINKILVGLEATNEMIDYAVINNVDLLIIHHPIIFNKLYNVLEDDLVGSKIYKLIKNNINVYVVHTNLDIAYDGLNDYVLSKFDFKYKKFNEKLDAIRYIELEKEYNIMEILEILKRNLELENFRYVKSNEKIKKIALVVGAGDSYIKEVIENKCDLLITGDLRHHVSLDAKEMGLSLVDVEHIGTEKFVGELLKKELLKIVDNDIEILEFKTQKVFEKI